MKKTLVGLLLILLIGAGIWHFFGQQILFSAMQKRAQDSLSGNTLKAMSGGLNVALCGAGSPMPDPSRAGPCTLIQAGDNLLVIDAGSGSPRNLGPMGIPAGEIDAVLLTHFHSDHIDGLGEMMLQRWAGGGHTQPLDIYGPPGVGEIVAGFNQAYQQDFSYRVAHHGPDIMPPEGAGGRAHRFDLPDAQGRIVYQQDGLVVTAFAEDHSPVAPAVGYRFDYQGRSVVISGDTVPTDSLRQFSQQADVLVSEALSPELLGIVERAARQENKPRIAQIMQDIVDYHTTPVQAAQIAAQSQAGYLLLTHIVPPLPLALLEPFFLRGVTQAYTGPVKVGRDGSWLHLPANSQAIQFDTLM